MIKGKKSIKTVIFPQPRTDKIQNCLLIFRRACPSLGASVSHDLLLGRWRLSLDLFGRVFTEDVGLEPGSVVAELGGFRVKEVKFRHDMEKLRNSQQKDLTLHKVCSIL